MRYYNRISILIYLLLLLNIFELLPKIRVYDFQGLSIFGVIRLIIIIILSTIFIIRLKNINYYFKKNDNILRIILVLFTSFLVFQLFVVKFEYTGLLKILLFLLFFSIIVFSHNQSKILINKLVNNLGKYNTFVFFISFLPLLLYFFSHPVSWNFRETRVEIFNWNPNESGGIYATFFPFFIYYFNNKFKSNQTLVISIIIFVLIIIIFYNGSRFAIVACTFSIYLFIITRNQKHELKKLFFKSFLALTIFYANITFLFGYDDFFSHNITALTTGNYQAGNLAGRFGGIWLPIFSYILDNSFLFGYGNNSYLDVASNLTYYVDAEGKVFQTFRDAHNFFIVGLVDWGIVGTIFILIIITIGFKTVLVFFIKYVNSKYYLFSIILLSSWIGLLLWYVMANAWYSGGWISLTILFCLTYLHKNRLLLEYKHKQISI